ncbi:MAG TPA: class I SAM-dependent methyltransferase [Rhodospirillaceae bacterium]|jgi:cyclopropane-fatty-acyl-phospholipid synthase|nr:class I SAM-dependent methyltransferase [Alphaproteobacteria bacterium]HBH25889.1 class I SAM-dependent methyltransferase [Rhodospirillaceae bacterium]
MIDVLTRRALLARLDKSTHGYLRLTTPEGRAHDFGGAHPRPQAAITLHDWAAARDWAARGDIGFADTYRAGRWDTPDLEAVAAFFLANDAALGGAVTGRWLARAGSILAHALRPNTRRGAQRNIPAHYDLGNDFYAQWLDPTMTYSAGIFTRAGESLDAAQARKYDRILERTGITSGRVLEVGCGWGGFADRATERGDYALTGITLSPAQAAYARTRLGDRADIALTDYREQGGRWDAIVSIEMFEAVGARYWPTYFQKLASLLRRGGRAVVQTITIRERDFWDYRCNTDFIRHYIFPGGMLPSAARFEAEAHKAGLAVRDRFAFGQGYACTLRAWLARFDAAAPALEGMGFDAPFQRLWRFYLAACAAGFAAGRTDVMQVEMAHA